MVVVAAPANRPPPVTAGTPAPADEAQINEAVEKVAALDEEFERFAEEIHAQFEAKRDELQAAKGELREPARKISAVLRARAAAAESGGDGEL